MLLLLYYIVVELYPASICYTTCEGYDLHEVFTLHYTTHISQLYVIVRCTMILPCACDVYEGREYFIPYNLYFILYTLYFILYAPATCTKGARASPPPEQRHGWGDRPWAAAAARVPPCSAAQCPP